MAEEWETYVRKAINGFVRSPRVLDINTDRLPGYVDDISGEYPLSTLIARDMVLYILHIDRRAKKTTDVDLLLSFSDSSDAKFRVLSVLVSRADLFDLDSSALTASLTDKGRARANEMFSASPTHRTTKVSDEVFGLVYAAHDGLSREAVYEALPSRRDTIDAAIGFLKDNGDIFEGHRNTILKITDEHRAERVEQIKSDRLLERMLENLGE